MAYVLKVLSAELVKANTRFNSDGRTSHLPLVGAPWPMLASTTIYLLIVRVWGPKFMAHRKPYNVKLPMQMYNVLQVLINAYVFHGSLRYAYMLPHFSVTCQAYDPLDYRPSNMQLLYVAYAYYISKYLDYFDTFFFVLRKKKNQISFLHVYHHTLMVIAVWIYMTLLFGSHFTATGVINSFVHVCMYSYYFTAALRLKVDLSAWKRRLTQLQIAQFCYLAFHFAQPLFRNPCGLDFFWVWVAFLQNVFMLVLFGDFYYKAYVAKGRCRRKNARKGLENNASHGVKLN